MTLLAWLFGLIVLIVAIAVAVAFLNRFYRKTSRDVALIRTGFGGQKIVLSGGTLALPFLHKVDEINMRTMRIEVSRSGAKSLITEDRMRVDVELEFYLRVQPTIDGVATAAQAIGSKSLSPDGVRNLLEGRFIDAIQATGRGLTMDSLHDRRAEFVRTIRESVRENLGAQRPAARVGVADADGPGRVRLARRQQRVQRGRPAQARRDHRHEQEEARRDRGRCRRVGAADAARGDQAAAQPLAPGRGGADRPAPRDREAQGGERRRHRARARAVDGRLRERAHRAREGDAHRRDPEAARAAQARDRGAAQLRGAQGRQLDRAAAKHAEEAQGAGPGRARAHRDRAGAGAAADRARARRRRPLARDRAQARAGARRGRDLEGAERDRGAADDRQGRGVGDDDARRGAAHPPDRRIGRHARADRGRELAQRRADAHAARAVPARPHARDHRPDDEAGREDRQHPHPPGHRLRRLVEPRPAAAAPAAIRAAAGHAGDGQHPRHGAAAAGPEEHRRVDRRGPVRGGRPPRTARPDRAAPTSAGNKALPQG